jgi:hypothetical protein
MGDNQGKATAADIDRGNVNARMPSIVLAASNTPNHNNDTDNDDANAKDAAGKKTLMRDGPRLELVVALRHWWSSFPCAMMTLVAACTIAPWRCQLFLALAMMTRCLGIVGHPLFMCGQQWSLSAIGDTLLMQGWQWQQRKRR